jgi:hypothetical protein
MKNNPTFVSWSRSGSLARVASAALLVATAMAAAQPSPFAATDRSDPRAIIYRLYGCSEARCQNPTTPATEVYSSTLRRLTSQAELGKTKHGEPCYDNDFLEASNGGLNVVRITVDLLSSAEMSPSYKVFGVHVFRQRGSDAALQDLPVTMSFVWESDGWALDDILDGSAQQDPRALPSSLRMALLQCSDVAPKLTLLPGQYFDSANGRVYQYVAAPGITWQQALNQAASKSVNGVFGSLAAVDSQAELDFIESTVIPGGAQTANVYVGGRQVAPGKWVWVAGPNEGTVFWNNGSVGAFSPWDPIYSLSSGAPASPRSRSSPYIYLNS